jgi:hypothetical protein
MEIILYGKSLREPMHAIHKPETAYKDESVGHKPKTL